jgi:hypothetical protein
VDAAVVRGWIRAVKEGNSDPAEVFPQLARNVTQFFLPFREPGSEPYTMQLRHENQRFGVVFTDPEIAASFAGGGQSVQSVCAFEAIQVVIRQELDGLIFNPDHTAGMKLDPQMVRLLYREYALEVMSKSAGAWVRVKADQIWIVELKRGLITVPIYLTESDAGEIGSDQGGAPELRPWADIRRQCRLAGAEAYLQFGHPEQCGVPRHYMVDLAGDAVAEPLDKLEQVLAVSYGIANAHAVWDAMAQLDFIWTLEDEDGAIVALTGVLDLFTSSLKADAFIVEARQKSPQLGAMYPRYLSAVALFRALAGQQPAICINRGSSGAWAGSTDTLMRVLERSQGAAAVDRPHESAEGSDPAAGRLSSLGRWFRRLVRY